MCSQRLNCVVVECGCLIFKNCFMWFSMCFKMCVFSHAYPMCMSLDVDHVFVLP